MTEDDEVNELESGDPDELFTDPTGELPPALCKALDDQPWEYAMGLRDGRVLYFQGAELLKGGKWVHLPGPDEKYTLEVSGVTHSFDRGLDVRISDIMWVADAPDGS